MFAVSTTFFLISSVILLMIATVYCLLERRKVLKYLGGLNRFPEVPLLGSAYLLAKANIDNFYYVANELLFKYKLPCFGFIGPTIPFLVLSDPEDVQMFLGSPSALRKPYAYDFFLSDRGLLSAAPSVWKVHRKILNPSFSLNVLKHVVVPQFKEKVDKLILDLQESNRDVLDALRSCTLDMITGAATGVQIDTKSKETKNYIKAMLTAAELVTIRTVQCWLHPDIVYRMTKMHHQLVSSIGVMKSFVQRVILSRKEVFEGGREQINQETIIDELVDGQPKTVANQLLTNLSNGVLDYKDVFDELDVIFYTATDTTSYLIAHTLLMLALHPQVEDNVLRELKTVFVSRDVPLDFSTVKLLVYLDRVIKETMRLFPVIPFIIRRPTDNVQLSEFTVPKGTIVCVPLTKMSRDPEVWGDDAEIFNPDRFLPEKMLHLHPSQFIPFSTGPRDCIGKVYAQLSSRLIISQILINFVPETRLRMDEIKVAVNVALGVTNPSFITLRKRNDFWN